MLFHLGQENRLRCTCPVGKWVFSLLCPNFNSTVLWASWKELKEQACFMASLAGKWVFCFPCPTLNSSLLWASWKELKEQACFMASLAGKWVFCFPCPTLNSSLLWASWKELKEQACFMVCPKKCAEELCPKCLSKHWTHTCPCADKITCLGWVDTVFCCTLLHVSSRRWWESSLTTK